MHFSRLWILAGVAFILALPGFAHGAAAVALHQVNTSAGLKNNGTVATEWKLETDPSDPTDADLGSYYPSEGSLSNTYDPTKLQLVTDENGNYNLGITVEGFGCYAVTGFKVLMNSGGYFDVTGFNDITYYDKNGNATTDPEGDGEAGVIYNINYELIEQDIPNSPNPPKPANQDQVFYDIFFQATDGNVTDDPGLASTFAATAGEFPGSVDDTFNTILINPNDNPNGLPSMLPPIGPAEITTSFSPEPTSLTLLGAGILGLLARRRLRA